MTAKRTTAPEPGPKPDYMVVENHLKCQTEEGEISLDLRLPIVKLERFMDMDDIEPMKMPRVLLDEILAADDKAQLEGMKDGAKAYAIIMEFAKRVGDRLGASLGESQGSTDSSESTVEPSDTTSEPASD